MQIAQTIQRKTRNHQSRSCFRKNIARCATRPSRHRKMDPFPAAGCSTFLRQSEANAIHFSIRANRRAPSSRARDDAKRIFRFERRDIKTRSRTARLVNVSDCMLLNATTRRVSSAVLFFLCRLRSLFSRGRRLLFPTRRGLITPQKKCHRKSAIDEMKMTFVRSEQYM